MLTANVAAGQKQPHKALPGSVSDDIDAQLPYLATWGAPHTFLRG